MLVPLADVLPVLNERRLCLPGIDVAGGQEEFVLGALRAFEAARCPALLLVWAPGLKDLDLELAACAERVGFYAARSPVPVVLHLDHGKEPQHVAAALRAGFRSIMFDGSDRPFEENLRQTRAMAEAVHAAGGTIEGELGRIGSAGDAPASAGALTDPDEAARFARETQIDLLAPAVGNAHGFYRQPPRLRFDLVERLAAATGLPLVLHGGTGIPMADIRRAAELGVRKLNLASQVHRDFGEALQQAAAPAEGKPFRWRDALGAAREAVFRRTAETLRELGAEGLLG